MKGKEFAGKFFPLDFLQGCKKAFIGPIGDDIPSLIPIVFALTIFFASFNAALSTFDKKNNGFADDFYALKIARVLRSNGYIVDF